MPRSPTAAQPGPDEALQRFSCLTCRQRKVKCDRGNPCNNCVKAARQCSFLAPVRGKRKRTKPPKEGLHTKVKRYEELLKTYGADIETSEYAGGPESGSASQPDVDMSDGAIETGPDHNSIPFDEARSRLKVDQDGSSRYLDASPWANMGGEYPLYPKEDQVVEPADEHSDDESDLLLGSPKKSGTAPNRHSEFETFASLHPPRHIMMKLWHTYSDRVDPMVKVLHLPTFWTSLIGAVEHPDDVSRCLRALICAFYLVTIASLEESECREILELEKPIVFARYQRAARRALKAAKFIGTSNPTTLRAYFLFLMGVRSSLTADTAFTLSGVALRLACKMGIHRDGSSLGFSPFETEMRRRLWWQIFHMDSRTSGLLGANPSMDLFSGDSKPPLNVTDEDLSPDMAEFPPERKCITPLVICLIRCEMAQFLRKLPTDNGPRDSPDAITAEREAVIREIQDSLETRFLRYCDPTVTLHIFVSILVRTSICVCRIKIGTHDIRKFASMGIKAPQSERDMIFSNATKMLEYLDLTRANRALDKYMWQAGTSVLWNAILWVLIEIRHRRVGPEVDRAWFLIGSVLARYPQMFEKRTGAVYAVLGKWTLEAWDNRPTSSQAEEFTKPQAPEWINTLRRCRSSSANPPFKRRDGAGIESTAVVEKQGVIQEVDTPSAVDLLASYDFSDLLNFEMDPAEWTQWESLLAVEEVGI